MELKISDTIKMLRQDAYENRNNRSVIAGNNYLPLLMSKDIRDSAESLYYELRNCNTTEEHTRRQIADVLDALYKVPLFINAFDQHAVWGDTKRTDKSLSCLEDIVRVANTVKRMVPSISNQIDEFGDAVQKLRSIYPDGYCDYCVLKKMYAVY